jgi:hypothetical protein
VVTITTVLAERWGRGGVAISTEANAVVFFDVYLFRTQTVHLQKRDYWL